MGLTGDEICNPAKRSVSVEGMIVVSDRNEQPCLLGNVYAELSAAGAKAYINTGFFDPPGVLTFRHHTWRACRYCNHAMPMVGAFDREVELVEICSAARNGGSSVELVIDGSDHDKTYQRRNRSLFSLLVLRILAPLFAVLTGCMASYEVYRQKKASSIRQRSVRLLICAIEAPSMFICAAVLALGQYGAMVCPEAFHLVFTSLLSGCSTFTTILLALFLHEEARHRSRNVPRRSIWKTYPKIICICAVVFFGSDLVIVLVTVIDVRTDLASLILGLNFVLLGVAPQIAIGLYLIYKGLQFRVQMYAYLSMSDSDRVRLQASGVQAGIQRIGRLAFWITISGASMFVSSASFGFLLYIITANQTGFQPGPYGQKWIVVAFVYSRILISFAQVYGEEKKT